MMGARTYACMCVVACLCLCLREFYWVVVWPRGAWGVALQRDYPVCWEIEGAGGRFSFLRGSQIHS